MRAPRRRQAREDARGAMHARGDGTLESLEHRVIVPGTVVAEPVHEERGRSRHPVLATVLDVALDARAHGLGVEVAVRSGSDRGRSPWRAEGARCARWGARDRRSRRASRRSALEAPRPPTPAPRDGRRGSRARSGSGGRRRPADRRAPREADASRAKAATVGAKEILVADDEHCLVAPGAANVIALRVDALEEPKLRCARVVRHGEVGFVPLFRKAPIEGAVDRWPRWFRALPVTSTRRPEISSAPSTGGTRTSTTLGPAFASRGDAPGRLSDHCAADAPRTNGVDSAHSTEENDALVPLRCVLLRGRLPSEHTPPSRQRHLGAPLPVHSLHRQERACPLRR